MLTAVSGLTACGHLSDPNAGAGLYPTGAGANVSTAYNAPYSAPPSYDTPRGGLALPGVSSIHMPHFNIGGYANSSIMPLPDPGRTVSDFSNIGYASWSDDEPSYRLYPGDELEVNVPSAPELSKSKAV
jgi:hypothetical protein